MKGVSIADKSAFGDGDRTSSGFVDGGQGPIIKAGPWPAAPVT